MNPYESPLEATVLPDDYPPYRYQPEPWWYAPIWLWVIASPGLAIIALIAAMMISYYL